LDIFLILIFLPLWAPLALVIAIGIKLASPGPVIFRQERVGYRGRRFQCLKFRSMHCNADSEVHKEHLTRLMKSGEPMVKLDGERDPRVIRGGEFLRASGLDELPQLLNVLRGDMSLVGPRPCTVYEYENYSAWHKQRFNVLPGITGLWQVTGKNKTSFDQMIALDVRYGETLSLKQDLWILMRTVLPIWEQVRDTITRRKRTHETSTHNQN